MVKVKFTKSPTGKFKLAYSIGQIGDLTKEMAKKVVESGYGEYVGAKPKKETRESKKVGNAEKRG